MRCAQCEHCLYPADCQSCPQAMQAQQVEPPPAEELETKLLDEESEGID